MIRPSTRFKLGTLMATVAALVAFGASGTVTAGASQFFEEYGIESLEAAESTMSAGMHPDFTTSLVFNHHEDEFGIVTTSGASENVSVALPPGLVADPNNVPRCSTGEFIKNLCPVDSQVGLVTLQLNEFEAGEVITEPLFNMQTPNQDMVARLGFWGSFVAPVYLDVSVRTGGDYGVTATVHEANGIEPLVSVATTIWGDPADPVHDPNRLTISEANFCEGGRACLAPGGERASGLEQLPFVSDPTACGDQSVEAAATSYELPGVVRRASALMSPITGCEAVSFQPSLRVEPTNHVAGAPTGLSAVLRIPQTNSVNLPATSPLRDASVTLPEGMAIAPGAADGLEGCSAAQVGYRAGLSVEAEEESPLGDAHCPEASEIGTATIASPDLPEPLHGTLYQRTPEEGHLFGLWLVSDELGVHLKIPAVIEANSQTGRLTAVFSNTPQVPVETIDLEIRGGARAPLKNPDACGTYEASYELTPWSGSGPVTGESAMTVNEGCGTDGFAPKLSVGTTNTVGGAFSPFTFDVSQGSGEQNLEGLGVTLPAGVLGKLAGIPLCSDSNAVSGDCPAASQIGSVSVAVGPGSSPLWVPQPGKAPTAVYLAGPYRGGPYSLVIKVPAQAGPFDLGTVTVRAGIYIDPVTARVTVKSDPLPQILAGVPIAYRTVHVNVDRAGFIVNPTNCSPLSVGATATSHTGTVVGLSNRFQVGDCANLAFRPSFKASTSGKTSRKTGASLDVKLAYPKGAFGKDANVRSVKVDLPRQLPSRLTTLQKACADSVFDANPASCPAASKVGSATATTPILADVLSGPAYFVGHGGAKFPELVVVLQGDGITVQLHGETFINKAGITSSTFRQVPDVPVSAFELKLPQGANSALAANGNLCASKLVMPTAFTAQNGMTIKQSTPISVTGCPKHKTKHKAKRKKGEKK